MRTRFAPASALRGTVTPPPDKSISHRAALVAAMNDEPVRIRHYLAAGDTTSTLRALQAVGVLVEARSEELVVRGPGLRSAAEAEGPIDVGNAGTLMRMLPGWLAAQPEGRWVLDGDASIRRRPVDRIIQPLQRMGGRLDAVEGRFPPLVVHGERLQGIVYELPVASAQVKSCLLLAGVAAQGDTVLREPSPSRDHTERLLVRAGVPVRRRGLEVCVPSMDELGLERVDVPGDLSSAAFWLAAGVLVRDSRLVIRRVGVNWTRCGFIRVLQRMGAIVLGDFEAPEAASRVHEPVSDLDVRAGPLRPVQVEPEEVALTIDELPLVALLGCFAEGETRVRGAGELRLKESDRIAGVVEGLRGLGAEIDDTPDGFAVWGTGGLHGGLLDARGDHRLAMMGAIAGLASTDGVEVEGMEAAAVSYPGFLEHLGQLT